MSEDTSASTPMTPSSPSSTRRPRRNIEWAPPTLYIPPPGSYISPSTPANLSVHSAMSSNVPPHNIPPHLYHQRASEFMFNQFSGIKDFTMSTAKSGLGIGEKSAFWLYNKLSSWSKRWFTHIFLSIVIVGYTVGGAFMFQTIEGRNEEKLVEIDIRARRRELIQDLRNLSIYIPQEKSVGEWHHIATERIHEYEDYVIENYRVHQLIVANHGPRIWTFWNAVVFCSTIYTTIATTIPKISLKIIPDSYIKRLPKCMPQIPRIRADKLLTTTMSQQEMGKSVAHNRNNQKRKSPLNDEELLRVACKRLQHLPDDYDKIAAAWAVELRKMDPQQQLFAKKAINDVIFEGLMGTLNRSSVKINMT